MRLINVTLDNDHMAKFERLAERMDQALDVVAHSLLCSALDEADPDPSTVSMLLEEIPSAYERTTLGAEQAGKGATIRLDEL